MENKNKTNLSVLKVIEYVFKWMIILALLLIGGFLALCYGGLCHGRPKRNIFLMRKKSKIRISKNANSDWRKAAVEEYESVGTFSQIASDLVDEGANLELVERCLHSALQEVQHARYAVEKSGGIFLYSERPSLKSLKLGVESYYDGYLGEGNSSFELHAKALQNKCGDLAQIALEERMHSDLGKDIYLWAVKKNPVIPRIVKKREVSK